MPNSYFGAVVLLLAAAACLETTAHVGATASSATTAILAATSTRDLFKTAKLLPVDETLVSETFNIFDADTEEEYYAAIIAQKEKLLERQKQKKRTKLLKKDGSTDHDAVVMLPPGAEEVGAKYYRLPPLEADTGYEVKISYLGSPPAQYRISLLELLSSSDEAAAAADGTDAQAVEDDGYDGDENSLSTGRKLQDTEKIMFRTVATSPHSLLVDGSLVKMKSEKVVAAAATTTTTMFVKVELTYLGVAKDFAAWKQRHFNIKLERLYLYVIPQSVVPLVCLIVLFLAIGLYLVGQLERNVGVGNGDQAGSARGAVNGSNQAKKNRVD